MDRIITIEANTVFTSKELIKSISLTKELEKSSALIVKCLTSVLHTGSMITSIKLIFKQDSFDRLHLLFCPCLKIQSPIIGTPQRVFDTLRRNIEYDIINQMIEEPEKSISEINTRDFKCKRCPVCMELINGAQLYEVNNATIVEMNEANQIHINEKRRLLSESYLIDNFPNKIEYNIDLEVPKTIQNLYPGRLTQYGNVRYRECV